MNAHFFRGQVLLDQERYLAAAEEFRQALAINPDAGILYGSLAIALMQGDRWQEALQCAQMAVQKDPDEAQSHATLGMVWLNREFHKEAEESISTSIELDPGDADGYGLLARVFCETNRHAEAVKVADVGLNIDSVNDLCLTFRARALISLGKSEEAHDVTETLLREDPLDSWNHFLRGDQLLMQGKPDEARVHFLESLRLQPCNAAARQGLAYSLKARSPIYAFLLGVMIRFDRVKPAVAWIWIIGLIFGFRALKPMVAHSPSLIVPLEILEIAAFGFLLLLYLANPIFDLLLRFDREGRTALSEDELRATNWYLLCFAAAGLCGIWAILSQKFSLPKSYGYAALFLCRPVSEVFQSTAGYVRKRLALVTSLFGAALVVVPMMAVSGFIASIMLTSKGAIRPLVYLMVYTPVAVMLYCCFSENLREWLERRRPDE